MLRRHPKITRTHTLFPYPPLFRSGNALARHKPGRQHGGVAVRPLRCRPPQQQRRNRAEEERQGVPGRDDEAEAERGAARHEARVTLRQQALRQGEEKERKSVVEGKIVSIRVDLAGTSLIKKKKKPHDTRKQ